MAALSQTLPSADKGANQPNVFYDPKSSERFLPYFSRGTRDDLIQRRALEAVLAYWAPSVANNPVSGGYSGRMIEAFGIWTWDARPFHTSQQYGVLMMDCYRFG